MSKKLIYIFFLISCFFYVNTPCFAQSVQQMEKVVEQKDSVAMATAEHFRYLCDDGGKPYFTLQPANNECQLHFLEEAWQNLSFSNDMIADYNSMDIVREDDAVKVWSRFFFAQPQSFVGGAFQYDKMRQINRFYCDKRQVYSIKSTFSLKGQDLYETGFPVEEIEPGTINDLIYRKACQSNKIEFRKISSDEIVILDKKQNPKTDYAFWILAIFQILFIQINWWGYDAYYWNPQNEHPRIFWNPKSRWFALSLPWIGMIGLIIAAFIFTQNPIAFFWFSALWWVLMGYRSYRALIKRI